MIQQLDRTAVLRGAAVAGGVALVLGLVGRAWSGGAPVLAILILAAMVVGGYVAAKPQPQLALSAGGVAALLGSAVVMVLSLVVAAVRGTLSPGDAVFVVFVVLLATSLGTLGGYVAFRRDQKASDAATTGAVNGNGGS